VHDANVFLKEIGQEYDPILLRVSHCLDRHEGPQTRLFGYPRTGVGRVFLRSQDVRIILFSYLRRMGGGTKGIRSIHIRSQLIGPDQDRPPFPWFSERRG